MPVVRFNNEDFLRGKVIKPGAYHILVKMIITQEAKTDKSAVYKLMHKVVEPGEYFGIPLEDYISEKAEGMAIPFVTACNDGVAPKPEENYELNNGIGKVIKAQIGNSLYNGRIKNEITNYMASDSGFKIQE